MNGQQQEPGLKGEGSLFKVTLHCYRPGVADLTTYHMAKSVIHASDSVWAAIPKDDQHNWSTTVELASDASRFARRD